MQNIFKDLKIVELAGVLAGPSVGYFFAELGAKVIKIENPKTNGDVTRSWKLKNENPKSNTSAYFWSVNGLKEFVSLDISQAKQLEKLYELVKDADIIISNYKKGGAEKLKVDYTTLSKLKKDLIYASINGFGNESPRTAYDLILQAESGFMFMNGEQNSVPTKMPVALIDIIAGHQLKEAILISLLKKYKTKKGSHISVSLFDSAVASLANQATNWLIGGHMPIASGSLHPNIAPYGELFITKDKQYITFAIGGNKQFEALCSVINYNSLSKDPKFSNNQNRIKNRHELYGILNNYISKFQFKDIFKACEVHEVPIGKIRNMKEVFELPEAKEMLREIKDDKTSKKVVSSIGFKFLK
ncbi:MAG: CoA transferase [Bacteroidota bacterium]|nr:CoA transferase [Bacteroidota bacterium]